MKKLGIFICVLGVVILGMFLNRDKTIEVELYKGSEILDKEIIERINNENLNDDDKKFILENKKKILPKQIARYGFKLEEQVEGYKFKLVEDNYQVKPKSKEEESYIKEMNYNIEKLLNSTVAILELYKGYNIQEDFYLANDLSEAILKHNDIIKESYENIKRLKTKERFDSFYVEFLEYYNDYTNLYEIQKECLYTFSASKREEAYNLTTYIIQNWSYLLTLYNY